MRTTWTFHSAGQILFGPGAVQQLGAVAGRLGLKRLLVVTDQRLIDAGVLGEVEGPLAERAQLEVFAGGEPEPSLHAAEACVATCAAFQPDGLIGLGGGSNMDLAKMAAAILAHGGTPRDYLGEDKIPGAGAAADLRAHDVGHGERGFGRGRVHRHRQSHQSQHGEQLLAAGRGGRRSAVDVVVSAQGDGR